MSELGRMWRMRSYCATVLDARGRWENVGLVLSEKWRLWRSDAQHVKVFNVEFASACTKMCSCHQAANTEKCKKKNVNHSLISQVL